MMLLNTLALALGLAAGVTTAHPLEERQDTPTPQMVHLTFHGGPAQYSMAFPADGNTYYTNHTFAIDTIDAPDYAASYMCQFTTPGDKTIATSITPDSVQHLLIGPPQPISAVTCQGFCVYVYGDCYRNGQYVGPCCNGFCAANKCRPWYNL